MSVRAFTGTVDLNKLSPGESADSSGWESLSAGIIACRTYVDGAVFINSGSFAHAPRKALR